MHISLRQGERLYLNGAVIRVDRKVSIELLNDASFLLEGHVMQVKNAITPLRQLYFVIQLALMSPNDSARPLAMCRQMVGSLNEAMTDAGILEGLATVAKQIDDNHIFHALKTVRELFPREAEIMGVKPDPAKGQAA